MIYCSVEIQGSEYYALFVEMIRPYIPFPGNIRSNELLFTLYNVLTHMYAIYVRGLNEP